MAKKVDKSLLKKRNDKIVARFSQLSDIKSPGGKRKYSYDFIYEKLSNEFYLSPITINAIIKTHE